MNANQTGVCAWKLSPTSSAGRLSGGDDLWAVCGWPGGRKKKSGFVLRLMRTVGTELIGDGELATELSLEDGGCRQGQLLRSRDRKAWEDIVLLPGVREQHLDSLLSQKPEKAKAITGIMSQPVPGSPRHGHSSLTAN